MSTPITQLSPTGQRKRHTRNFPCKVCGGYDELSRHQGIRCHGYTTHTGKTVYCSREEHAGPLSQHSNGLFGHGANGKCRCGQTHGDSDRSLKGAKNSSTKRPLKTEDFIYEDIDRNPYTKVQRIDFDDHKKIFQYRYENGQWQRSLTNKVTGKKWDPILYRLPELANLPPGSTIYIVEGEKKVDLLRSWELNATCNPMGAGKWRAKEHASYFKEMNAILIPDEDNPDQHGKCKGLEHMFDVARSLQDIAKSIKLIRLPRLNGGGSDIIDWVEDHNGTKDELLQLIDSTDLFEPPIKNNPSCSMQFALTDLGNAERFAHQHRGSIRFCYKWNSWFVFDGMRWRQDDSLAWQMAKKTARTIQEEAEQL